MANTLTPKAHNDISKRKTNISVLQILRVCVYTCVCVYLLVCVHVCVCTCMSYVICVCCACVCVEVCFALGVSAKVRVCLHACVCIYTGPARRAKAHDTKTNFNDLYGRIDSPSCNFIINIRAKEVNFEYIRERVIKFCVMMIITVVAQVDMYVCVHVFVCGLYTICMCVYENIYMYVYYENI